MDFWAGATIHRKMKIKIPVLLWVMALGAAPALAAGTGHRLVFEKDDAVWTVQGDGSGQKKIADGQCPDLSPDGTKLAFNTVQEPGQPAHRQIAVANPASGKVTIFKNIPSGNCMEPHWSPDGGQLLFYYYNAKGERLIGLVLADGSGFQDVLGAGARSYWALAWAADGKSFFCEDMECLYRLGLDGKVLKKWIVAKLVPRGGMSGEVRLDASPDGRLLLMDVEMEEKERKDWDGPPPAIWVLDLISEKATRLTPTALYAWDCHWLKAPDTLLMISQGEEDEEPSIYSMSVSGQGKDRKLLVKNARTPGAPR